MAPDNGAAAGGVEDSGDTFGGDGPPDEDVSSGVGQSDDNPFDWEDSASAGFEPEAPATQEGDQQVSASADDNSSDAPTGEGVATLDASMVQLAESAGIDRAQAERLHKAGLLGDAIRSNYAAASAQPATPETQTAAAAAPSGDDQATTIEFDESQFEPEVVAVLNQFKNALNASATQNQTLRDQISSLEGGIQAQRLTQFEQDFDRRITALDGPAKQLVGDGPTSGLDQNSPEYLRRSAIERNYFAMLVGAKQLNYDVDADTAFQAAAAGVLTQDANSLARRELNRQTQQLSKQHVTRPTKRAQQPGDDPEKVAIQNVRNKLAELGEPVEDYSTL